MDAALAALYDADAAPATTAARPAAAAAASARRRRGWRAGSATSGAYFPSTVVQVMQADAIERLDLTRLLLEPEMLDAVEPDVHLVGTLLVAEPGDAGAQQAGGPRGRRARSSRDLERRIAQQTRAARDRRAQPGRPDQPAAPPRHRLEPHDPREPASTTSPSCGTIVPERLIGYGRRATRGAARRGAAASTSPARWRRRSSTPACSPRCSPRCARCARRWWSSTPPWST